MELRTAIEEINRQIPGLENSLSTEEEGTKHALILPLLRALGYNDSDRAEVVPEFIADPRSNERVDYAIISGSDPLIVIECKAASVSLSDRRVSQLNGYFNATSARIGILTNGIEYRFFSDFEKPNLMDQDPFWEIDVENMEDSDLEQLHRLFTKGFSIEETLDSASRLKDIEMMTRVLKTQYSQPDESFVKWLARAAYSGRGAPRWTAQNLEKFKDLANRAFVNFVGDTMRSAQQRTNAGASETEEDKDRIITTAQEMEAYHMVKAIVRDVIDPGRVSYRDRVGHCIVLVDDNGQKPLCHLLFNNDRRKQIRLFDENRDRTLHGVGSLDDIYAHADQLRGAARRYLEP